MHFTDHTSAPYVALWDHTHFYHENSITLCIALSPHHHFCYHTSLPFYVSCRMYPKLPVAANQYLAFTHTGETRDLIGCYRQQHTFVVHLCEWDYFFLFSPIGDDIFSAHSASNKKKKIMPPFLWGLYSVWRHHLATRTMANTVSCLQNGRKLL